MCGGFHKYMAAKLQHVRKYIKKLDVVFITIYKSPMKSNNQDYLANSKYSTQSLTSKW